MIRPSHKSTKRKKSPQRVLGQRAGGAGGGREEEAGLVAVPPERLGDSSTGRFGTGGTRRRRTAMPAACGLCPLGRSAPFGAGRSEPGPEGRGAGPAASVPPGTTLDAVLVTRGPRGPSARAELSPAPPPPPTPRGGRGPGRSVGRQPALRTRLLPASGGGVRRPAEWPEWRAPLSPHRKAAASPPRGESRRQEGIPSPVAPEQSEPSWFSDFGKCHQTGGDTRLLRGRPGAGGPPRLKRPWPFPSRACPAPRGVTCQLCPPTPRPPTVPTGLSVGPRLFPSGAPPLLSPKPPPASRPVAATCRAQSAWGLHALPVTRLEGHSPHLFVGSQPAAPERGCGRSQDRPLPRALGRHQGPRRCPPSLRGACLPHPGRTGAVAVSPLPLRVPRQLRARVSTRGRGLGADISLWASRSVNPQAHSVPHPISQDRGVVTT